MGKNRSEAAYAGRDVHRLARGAAFADRLSCPAPQTTDRAAVQFAHDKRARRLSCDAPQGPFANHENCLDPRPHDNTHIYSVRSESLTALAWRENSTPNDTRIKCVCARALLSPTAK